MQKNIIILVCIILLTSTGIYSCNNLSEDDGILKDDINKIEQLLTTDPSLIGKKWRKTPENIYLVTTKEPLESNNNSFDVWGKNRIIKSYINAKKLDNTSFIEDSSYICHFLQNHKNSGGLVHGMTLGMQHMKAGEEVEMLMPSLYTAGGSISSANRSIPNGIMRIEIRNMISRDSIEYNLYECANLEEYAKVKYPNSRLKKIGDQGLIKVVLREGNPKSDLVGNLSQATISYKGTLLDGKDFDNQDSYIFHSDKKQPIEGFEQGIKSMRKGEHSIILIPSHLGYYTAPPVESMIPLFEPLVFDVEVKEEEGDYLVKDMEVIEHFLNTDPNYIGKKWRKTLDNIYLVTTKAPIDGSHGEIDFEEWGKNKIIHAYVNAKRFDNVTFMKDEDYVCHFLQNKPNAGTFIPGMTLGMKDMKAGEEVEMFIPSPLAMGSSSGTIGGTYIAPNTIMRVNVRNIVAYDSIEQRHYEIKQLEDYAKSRYPGFQVEKIGNAGLMKVVLQAANPDSALVSDSKQINISYKGTLLSGRKFDQNENFVFSLSNGQFIEGWTEGLKTMRKGEKSVLLIPSNLGYYATPPRGSIIKQFSPLIFEIEVKNIK